MNSAVLHDYDFTEVDRLAAVCANTAFAKSLAFSDRRDAAHFGIVAALLEATQRPTSLELLHAGRDAIARAGDAEVREHGWSHHKHTPAPAYVRYWHGAPRLIAPWEETVIERIATWQIWGELRYEHQQVLWALALNDDHRQAAHWCGLSIANYQARLSQARKRFRRFWYYPEADPGPWGRDRRHTSTGPDSHTVMQSRKRTLRRKAAND